MFLNRFLITDEHPPPPWEYETLWNGSFPFKIVDVSGATEAPWKPWEILLEGNEMTGRILTDIKYYEENNTQESRP